jgi:peptide deformylase
VPVDPSELALVIYPSQVLRRKADPIPEVTDEVRAVAETMIEIMEEEEGIGLAGPQVGLSWRIFVVDLPDSEARRSEAAAAVGAMTFTDGPVVYINPVLERPRGEVVASEEGCLSLPDIRGDVLRPTIITITATGLDGKRFTQTGTGLLARCWQHENDHLDGVLIIDKMTQMSRIKNRAAVRELERRAGER